MTALRSPARFVSVALLLAGLMGATAACGTEAATSSASAKRPAAPTSVDPHSAASSGGTCLVRVHADVE
ncbi:hypothetical protein SALBM311S_01530 [Streptomyces alboniger]